MLYLWEACLWTHTHTHTHTQITKFDDYDPRLRVLPAVVEEGSADKVTVVLAAAAAGSPGTLQAGPVGVGCVLVAAVEAETVPAVAARVAAEALVWIPGSWTDPVIQGYPVNLAAAGPGWEDPAAGHTETGQTVVLRLGNKVAETVGALGMDLAVAPGTGGACGAADRVVLPGCVSQKLAEGGVALGKESGHLVVLVGAGSRGFAAGPGEEPGQAGRNTVPGPGSRSLLVPAVHMIPSKQNIHKTLKKTEENTDKKDQIKTQITYFWVR